MNTMRVVNVIVVSVSCALILWTGLTISKTRFIGAHADQNAGFYTDQIRDALVYEHWRHGEWPVLGPAIQGTDTYLPPLFYYLLAPISIWTRNPLIHTTASSLFSALTPFALFGLIWVTLNHTSWRKKLLLGSFGSALLTSFVPDIIVSNRIWNPVPLPYFTVIWIVLAWLICRTQKVIPYYQQFFLWSCFGGITAVAMNLHSTALVILPVTWVAFVLYYLWEKKQTDTTHWSPIKTIAQVFISVISGASIMIPYWSHEISNRFQNTKNIIHILGSNRSSAEAAHWFDIVLRTVNRLGEFLLQSGHLISDNRLPTIALAVLFSAIVLFFLTYKGPKSVGLVTSVYIILYIGASALSTTDLTKWHYHTPLFPLYILLIVWLLYAAWMSLEQVNRSRSWYTVMRSIGAALLIGLVSIMLLGNAGNIDRLIARTEDKAYPPTYAEIKEHIAFLQDGEVLCSPSWERWNQYAYILEYDPPVRPDGTPFSLADLSDVCKPGMIYVHSWFARDDEDWFHEALNTEEIPPQANTQPEDPVQLRTETRYSTVQFSVYKLSE